MRVLGNDVKSRPFTIQEVAFRLLHLGLSNALDAFLSEKGGFLQAPVRTKDHLALVEELDGTIP